MDVSYKLLNQLGLSGFDYSYLLIGLAVISIISLILVIVMMFQIIDMKKRYKKFMGGKDVKSLEKQIERILTENQYIKSLSEDNKKDVRKINKKLETTFSKLGIVKYDAFQQMGGKLSFSIALLNEIDDGYLLNSVHSMEGCYSYVKVIKNGLCEIDLSKEEKEALTQAMKVS